MGDDTVVKCMGLNKYAIGSLFDGREVMIEKEGLRVSDDRGRMVAQPLDASVKLYKTLIDAADLKKLKPGIAEAYAFHWFNDNGRRLSEARARGWFPVSKRSGEVIAPQAYGNETDDYWHMGDNILCKRATEESKAESNDLKYFNDSNRKLEEQDQINADLAERVGAKGFNSKNTAADADGVVIGSGAAD
jgi:hypothetical protein